MAPLQFLGMTTSPPSSPIVSWPADGTPRSARFGDIYRAAGSGLAQARHVFLGGCGLLATAGHAAAWAGAKRWGVLENGFGLGLNFLATRLAWEADAAQPERLFYTAIEAWPPTAADLVRSAAPYPSLHRAAAELAAQWCGLTRGVHRLEFAHGRLQLTLVIGPVERALRALSGRYESLYLDGFAPTHNPEMWSAQVIAGLARHAAPGARAATWCVARTVRDTLTAHQFRVERVPGLPPKRQALRATYQPVHVPASPRPLRGLRRPGSCAVVGAGLAGAAVAHSLARRGWSVTVVEQARHAASGASAVPAGLFVPHVTPDDDPLARLSRAGIRATLAYARSALRTGVDYAETGVLERHAPGKRRLPQEWQTVGGRAADRGLSQGPDAAPTQARAALAHVALNTEQPALWHPQAGWMRPAALAAALLATRGVRFAGGVTVRGARANGAQWELLADTPCDAFDLVVFACGLATGALASAPWLPLHALAGQITMGATPLAGAPEFPVNGSGYLIPLPVAPDRIAWVGGSTFERDRTRSAQTAAAQAANTQQLAQLLPGAAAALRALGERGQTRAWCGVRATLPDHLPAIGPCAPPRGRQSVPGAAISLQVCTGFGARGLSLALLCAEVLAAQLHDEPLPVSRNLARHLQAARFFGR